ncbi:MAG: hypothetical protein J7K53_07030 [Bacteroidales bacterium]|nr:hypothetical protein [Bacteroidales bacterium]
MSKKPFITIFLVLFCFCLFSVNGLGQTEARIINIDFNLVGEDIVITYDIVNYAPGEKFIITIEVVTESGKKLNTRSLTGDVGSNISGGSKKQVTWDFKNDNIKLTEGIYVEVIAKSLLVIEKPEPPKKKSLGGAFVKSLVFPGWGNTSISSGPYWLFGFAGYGCAAGSVLFNMQSYQSLEDYKVSLNIDERDQLFSDAESQNQLSTILMAGAAAIWVTDITILLIKGNKPQNLTYKQNSTVPKLGYTIDPISKSPLMTLKITF